MTNILNNQIFLSSDFLPENKADNYFIRILQKEDWFNMRELRLDALKYEGRVFASLYEKEKAFPIEYWQNRCIEDSLNCTIGIFDQDELIGMTAISQWDEDSTGRTALFGSSYILLKYRGLGLAHPLYAARIEWGKACPSYDTAVVHHRDTNWRSKLLNETYGAKYLFTRSYKWADGQTADDIWYSIDLK